MRSVLVTGCSSGFGLETAVALARRGWQVFATMRNLDKRGRLDDALAKAALGDRVTVLQLDVTEGDSIKRAVEATDGVLDAVVNNAGVAGGGFFEDLPEDEWRRVFETNVFGVMAVTKAVLPLMRERRRGRIIVVSSDSAFYGSPSASIYTASKWAIEGWAESVDYEVRPFGIRLVCVEPGAYRTDIWETSPRFKPPGSAYAAAADILERFVDEKHVPGARDPREVGRVIADALEVRNPRFRYTAGPDAKLMSVGKRFLPLRAVTAAVRRYSGLHRWNP
jgi:NAD(P)-dependent dehydrogenase (short-subunit alcohol dehydrogenase family)